MWRSTKAGASTPATHADLVPEDRRFTLPLNEGRGINPGDTATSSSTEGRFNRAQRRPGHQPRRHYAISAPDRMASARAQRRPGHQPRRHC